MAAACDDTITLLPEQIEADTATLLDSSKPLLVRDEAYQNLACSDQTSVRTRAHKIALTSDDEGLRTLAIGTILFSRSTIVLELRDDGNLSKDVKDYSAENDSPIINLRADFPDENCIATSTTYDKKCTPGYMIQIISNGIMINSNRISSTALLNPEGILEGEYRANRKKFSIPYFIRLF